MAYNPTNWKTGDIITAQKLNKAEDAIRNNSALFVTGFLLSNGLRLDTFYNTIDDAMEAGRPVIVKWEISVEDDMYACSPVLWCGRGSSNAYEVGLFLDNGMVVLRTNDPEDYPQVLDEV